MDSSLIHETCPTMEETKATKEETDQLCKE